MQGFYRGEAGKFVLTALLFAAVFTCFKAVQPGWLFAALAGSSADGARFVKDAVARGATAVLGVSKVF